MFYNLADSSISILMFQLPFGGEAGRTINTTSLCNRIDISKDGDGLNQVTLGLMSLGADRYYDCCTPSGMVDLASVYLVREKGVKLRPDGIASFAGLEVLVAGRSAIVGEPLFNLLRMENELLTLLATSAVVSMGMRGWGNG